MLLFDEMKKNNKIMIYNKYAEYQKFLNLIISFLDKKQKYILEKTIHQI